MLSPHPALLLQVAGDLEAYPDGWLDLWRPLTPGAPPAAALGEAREALRVEAAAVDRLAEGAFLPFGNCVVTGIGAVQSGYLSLTVPCGAGWGSAEEPPVMVLCEYLSGLEGPLWKEIRGNGLAYGADVFLRRGNQELSLSIAPATDPVGGLEKAVALFRGLTSGALPIDAKALEAAKSSCIYAVISREDTLSAAAKESLLANLRGVPRDHNKQCIARIKAVTADEVRAVMGKYLSVMAAFPGSSSALRGGASLCLVTATKKVRECVEAFGAKGLPPATPVTSKQLLSWMAEGSPRPEGDLPALSAEDLLARFEARLADEQQAEHGGRRGRGTVDATGEQLDGSSGSESGESDEDMDGSDESDLE